MPPGALLRSRQGHVSVRASESPMKIAQRSLTRVTLRAPKNLMQKLILFLVLLVLTSVAGAADSPNDVQALIARGDYPGAEAMLRDAIAEHPQSAKAHYVLAEVLAHEGNIGDAKAEASKAAALDPGTHFTDPAKFQAFQHKLDAALAPVSNGRSSAAPVRYGDTQQPAGRQGGGSSHLTGILVIGAVLALIVFLWMRRKRNVASPFSGYASTPPMDGVPPYGGYSGAGPYAPPPQPHSGVGTAVAAGLGGVAAGMLLDEALRSHREGEGARDAGSFSRDDRDPSSQAYDDLRSDPVDMGNNDNSWDDSSSGDFGSSDDNSW